MVCGGPTASFSFCCLVWIHRESRALLEMGILGLSKLLYQECPGAIKEEEMKNFFGRRIAIDASMSIYQFVIAMKGFSEGQGLELMNEAGEVTSHLNGLFTRTLRMVDEGLKPIYVFDGAPPEMKRAELDERKQKAEEAQAQFAKAKEEGDDEMMEKMSKRTVRVSRDQIEECKKLLTLMGIPVVQAAGEAEAQCAELVRHNKAWAVATEDMDALTFGSKILVRHLTFSEAKKRPIAEYHMDAILAHTGLTMEQFIDLCILLGCDYVPKIPGVGPHRAWEGIKTHKTIEAFIATLDPAKHPIPPEFDFEGARKLFVNPDVVPASEVPIEFREPDEEGLIKFLVQEKLFNKDRVDKGIQRLRAALQKKVQGRLDSFFKIIPKAPVKTAREDDKKSSAEMPSGKMLKTGANGAKKAVRK
jgi:flap endonuclease-1